MSELVAQAEEKKRCVRTFGSDEFCPICLLPMRSEVAVLVPCKHTFCIACCTTFLRTNIDTQTMPCPVCRSLSSLAEVETLDGQNLREMQFNARKMKNDEMHYRYFEVTVNVQMVNYGIIKKARHAAHDQALTPSAKTSGLFEICDSCFFQIQAQAYSLQAPGKYDAFLHLKRLMTFSCDELVTVQIFDHTDNIVSSNSIDLNQALQPNAWTMLYVGSIHLLSLPLPNDHPPQKNFSLTLQADCRDWWKTGLIVDCLAVSPTKKIKKNGPYPGFFQVKKS